jgi:hypothetical protein
MICCPAKIEAHTSCRLHQSRMLKQLTRISVSSNNREPSVLHLTAICSNNKSHRICASLSFSIFMVSRRQAGSCSSNSSHTLQSRRQPPERGLYGAGVLPQDRPWLCRATVVLQHAPRVGCTVTRCRACPQRQHRPPCSSRVRVCRLVEDGACCPHHP